MRDASYDASNPDETWYIATDPSQIKSADPITRDDAGNIIPLSARFNPASPDIRYSVTAGPDPSTAAARSRDASRPTDALGLYSQLRATLTTKMPARATAQALRGLIDPAKGSGIKADELRWSGFQDFLDLLPPDAIVTREQALGAIRDVPLQETVLGVGDEPTQEDLDTATSQIYPGRTWASLRPEQQAQVRRDIREDLPGSLGQNRTTRSHDSKYTTPGSIPGTYRERLIQMPLDA